jgi:hypothetical protein
MATTYKVRVVRGDQQFEAEGDKKFVLEMLARFDRPTTPFSSAPAPAPRPAKVRTGSAPTAAAGKAMSAGEFIRQLHFKKHTDLVLAFGYYLEKHSDLKSFAVGDINNCYYEAKLESSNTSQMIIQNIKRGCMMEAKAAKGEKGGYKMFTLTRSGEEYLEAALAGGSEE